MHAPDYLVAIALGFVVSLIVFLIGTIIVVALFYTGLAATMAIFRWPLWLALLAWAVVTALLISIDRMLVGL